MKIKNLFKKIIIPIKEEIIFFFFSMLLLLPRTLLFPILRPDLCFGDWTNYNTVRFVSIGACFSYLFTWSVYKTHSSLLKGLTYLFLYVLFFLNVYLALNFKATISPNTLLLLLETTPVEAQDFLITYAFSFPSILAYLLTIVLLCSNAYLEYKKKEIIQFICSNSTIIRHSTPIIYCFFFLFVGGIFSSKIFFSLITIRDVEDIEKWNSKGLSSMDLLTGLVYSVCHLNLMGDMLKKTEGITLKAVDSCIYSKNDSCNLVLIIGESFIKNHSSLYGYYLNTNPRLRKEKSMGRLFVFSDVVTSSDATSSAIKNVMSCNSVGCGENWYNSPFFPAIFKKAGYNVYFWDNQYIPTSNASFDFSLNSYLHSPVISSLSYTAWHDHISRIDGEIVDDFRRYKTGHNLGKKNLVIFHLQGQHFDQKTRYPQTSDFRKFTSKDINRNEPWMTESKRKVIAHYDNCTYYNDSVIASIISLFRNEPTVMIYFSDHGECIYDIGDYYGRGLSLSSDSPDYVQYYQHIFEIPFVIWCSDKFLTQDPELLDKIKKATTKPLMTDNVCQILMTLGGVKSKYYNSSRDVLSDDYHCTPRIISESIDYDQLVK